ncbi:MAG: ribosome-associated translation inhibitor RaiA [Clostridiales bacterium]|jgi:putative sigma-54 modulation protein|nr:ribosome-associated translation inhibitor RaiA [Clostridiales bacterium]
MKIQIITKDYALTDALSDVVRKKLARLDKLFGAETEAKVLLKQVKETCSLELTIYADRILRAEVKSVNDMPSNIDAAIRKLCRQIDKHKSKFDAKLMKEVQKEREYFAAAADAAPEVVRRKMHILKPLTLEEAIVEIDLVDHDFFVYLDSGSNGINVLYRRADGNLGVIETSV